MASLPEDASYWASRAEKETELSRRCGAEAANAHRARASRFRDLAHQALRMAAGRPFA